MEIGFGKRKEVCFGENLYGKPSDEDIDFRDEIQKGISNSQFYILEQGIIYEYTNEK
jgi:hypothetical protein